MKKGVEDLNQLVMSWMLTREELGEILLDTNKGFYNIPVYPKDAVSKALAKVATDVQTKQATKILKRLLELKG